MEEYSKMTALELCREQKKILLEQRDLLHEYRSSINTNVDNMNRLITSYRIDIARKDEIIASCYGLIKQLEDLCGHDKWLRELIDNIENEICIARI